jgi:hypothetical protein
MRDLDVQVIHKNGIPACTRCRTIGKVFPPDGSTKADMIICPRCEGTGFVEPRKRYKQRQKRYYYGKNDLIHTLDDVEGV